MSINSLKITIGGTSMIGNSSASAFWSKNKPQAPIATPTIKEPNPIVI